MGEATQGTMKTVCSYLTEVELVMVNDCSSVTKGDILLMPDVFFSEVLLQKTDLLLEHNSNGDNVTSYSFPPSNREYAGILW